jgi:hypothetical protein
MADISKIKLPNITTPYNIKDATALHMGSTAIGGTSTPIYWNGTAFTPTGAISSSDTKVTQSADTSGTNVAPMIIAYNDNPTSGTASTVRYRKNIGMIPATRTMVASTYALNDTGVTGALAGVKVTATADGGWVWSD